MSFPRYPKYKDSGVEWLGDVPKVAGIFQMPSANVAPNEPRPNAETRADGTWNVPATGTGSLRLPSTNFITGLNNV